MLKTGDTKRQLGIKLVVLAVLVAGITATGYADPTEQITGPAVVGGTLTVVGNPTDVTVSVSLSNGQCRGTKGISPSGTNNGTLPNSLTLGDITAARLLEGLRFTVTGGASLDCPLIDLIVKAAVPSKFMIMNTNGVITVTDEVVLLFVVTP